MWSSRIGDSALASLCQRLSTGLASGVDVRRICEREASGGGPATLRGRFAEITTQIRRGESLAKALASTGAYFPPLFRELVQIGEEAGHAPEVLKHLAEHYRFKVELRRIFLLAIAWPAIELFLAILVIGLLIWVMGVIPAGIDGQPIDVLGFGLVGNRGLLVYLLFLASLVALGWLVWQAMRRAEGWAGKAAQFVMAIPGVGGPLETLALSHLCWSLRVCYDAGMDTIRAVRFALAATNNPRYTRHAEWVARGIRSGRSLHDVLAETQEFPPEFLDTLQVAEQSGRISETLGVMGRNYLDQSRAGMRVLSIVAGVGVGLLVAIVIIALIFRLAGFYFGIITDLADPLH
jgi:type II secretory pathway component PulF